MSSKDFSIERRLAEFALSLKFEDLPGDIITTAKRLLLDALGCAFGAINSEPARIVQEVMRSTYTGAPTATVIGGGLCPIEHAIAVNGVLVRYLDYNDVYIGQDPLHPSEIIPIALAVCEQKEQSGAQFIATLVAGYEAKLRINDAVGFLKRGFHPLSAGAFAGPLVAGKAWDLPVDQIAHAVGIAGCRGQTSFVVNKGDISMMKALGHAWSSLDAIFAARLAANGFTGPKGTLDWIATVLQPAQSCLDLDLDPYHFRLPFVSLKRYPLQYQIQAAVEAGAVLHESCGSRLESLSRILIGTYPNTIDRVASPDKYLPATREAADHSLPVCVAMALLTGDVNPGHFKDDVWRRADVLDLVGKIEVAVDADLAARQPNGRGASVTLFFDRNPPDQVVVDIPKGDAARPLSETELVAKFLALTVPVIGDGRARTIVALVNKLEHLSRISLLTETLRSPCSTAR